MSRLIDEIQLAKANDLRNYSAGNTTLSEWAEKCIKTYSKEYVRSVYSSHLTITEPKTASSIRKSFLINELKNELLDYKQKVIELKKAKNSRHSEEDFLFCSKKNTPIEPRRFYQYYQELLKLAGIEDATFHSLRHTFATRRLGTDLFDGYLLSTAGIFILL